MIKKFQNFNVSLHEHNDVDPFDEEDWSDPEILDDKDLIEIAMKTPLKTGDKIYTYDNIYDGVIIEDFKDGNYMVRRRDRDHFLGKVQFYIFGYKLRVE